MLNATKVAQLRKDIDAALAAVAAKHGVDFQVGRILYNAEGMRCKLTGTERGAAGTNPAVKAKPEAVALVKNAWVVGHGFDVTKKYRSNSLGVFKVTGYKTQAKKYPFIIESASGKSYKVSAEYVRQAVINGAVA
jgi:hypothetical protein